MAAADRFTIAIDGSGGHAAQPHDCIDPVRRRRRHRDHGAAVDRRRATSTRCESAVVSVCTFQRRRRLQRHPADAPSCAAPCARFDPQSATSLESAHARRSSRTSRAAYGAKANVTYDRGYPVTVNHAEQTDSPPPSPRDVAGDERGRHRHAAGDGRGGFLLHAGGAPRRLHLRRQRRHAPALHHPAYDFNDEAMPYGVSLWAKIVETAMPAR